MKCPNPKCKSNLSVARTYAEPTRTVRERRCPKCGTYHRTVEVFDTELNALNQELHDTKHQRTLEQYGLERELNEMKSAIKVLLNVAKEEKGKR